jgi:hypothetical protein
MNEVWYTEEGISQVSFFPNLDDAVRVAAKIAVGEKTVFDYLIEPGGIVRNDLVEWEVQQNQKKAKKDKAVEEGKTWAVEARALHRDDYWAIATEASTQSSANAVAESLAESIGLDRVRVRQL